MEIIKDKLTDLKLCKDCDHVDRTTLRIAISEMSKNAPLVSDTYVICNRPVTSLPPYISPVTGKETKITPPILYCIHERTFGGCKNTQHFKPQVNKNIQQTANIVSEFYKNAKPTNVFKSAHKKYLKWLKSQPDPDIEQIKLWDKLKHQTPGSETL